MIDPKEILARISIIDLISETVRLKKQGQQHYGLCPYHADKSPTLRVDPNRGLWHCPSCQIGGDAFSWLKHRDHIGFREAVRDLAIRTGIDAAPGNLPAERVQLAPVPEQPRYPLQRPGALPWGGQRLMQGNRPVLVLDAFPGRRRYLALAEAWPLHDICWYPSIWDGSGYKGPSTPAAAEMYLPPIARAELAFLPAEPWEYWRQRELVRLCRRFRAQHMDRAA